MTSSNWFVIKKIICFYCKNDFLSFEMASAKVIKKISLQLVVLSVIHFRGKRGETIYYQIG